MQHACTCMFSAVIIHVVYLGTLLTRAMRRGVTRARPPAVTKHTGRGARFAGAAGESLPLASDASSAATSETAADRSAHTGADALPRARNSSASSSDDCRTVRTCFCTSTATGRQRAASSHAALRVLRACASSAAHNAAC